MALSLDRSGMNLSFGENVTSISVDDDFVKLITNEIIEILQPDEEEMGVQIVRDLLENGRQSLVIYKNDIISKTYDEVMNGNDNKLMSSLKTYFRQKWEIQYGSSNSWFISFLKQYENGENHDIYGSILTRTAQYGNKYMKDCPLLSVVLQLLFESVDDDCLQETNNVFDDLWMTVTNDGLQSITNYSNYIPKKVLDEQLEKQSVLFEALREYYRPNVFLSLTQSAKVKKQNLYDLALNDVVEHGWLSDMKSIQSDITPNRYQTLLKDLRSFYKKQKSSQIEDPNGSDVSPPKINLPALPERDSANNEEQDNQGPEDNKSDFPHDPMDDPDDLSYSKDTIFISGLPTNISKQRLFDALLDVFTSCGDIKLYPETNKPDIWLITRREDKSRLNGTAKVTFEQEESTMIAIGKYNGQKIPALNNTQISVRINRLPKGAKTPKSTVPTGSGPKTPSTINTGDAPRPKRDESVSFNGSVNSGIVNTTVLSSDTIYITGLPTSMPEQRLFDTLWDEFRTVGPIKIDKETNKPCIYLFKIKGSRFQLTGAAKVTFENEASLVEAIENYNGQPVSSLNDSQLCVQRSNMRPVESVQLFGPRAQLLLQPSSVQMRRPERQPDGPVSIFWDFENVAIPAGNNAFNVLLKLRKQLMEDRKLREGTIKTYYRNIDSIPQQHRTNLHHANVLAQHIESTGYGAVDMEIHKDLQRFIEQHKTPATVVLISGDIDFITDLSDLRFRHGHYTIVIHNPQAKEQLLKTANEFIPWEAFFEKKCPNIYKPKDNLRRTYSRKHNLDKTRPSTPPAKRPSLMELNVDESAANTDNNVLDSTSTVANRPKREKLHCCAKKLDVSKNEPRSQKKHHKNENKPDAQSPLDLLSSLAGNPSNATQEDANSVISSPDKTKKPGQEIKPAETAGAFSCSMCDKKFTTDTARIQHEQAKHKVGTLVEIFMATSTNDSHSCSQSSDHDNQLLIDLIAFSDDEGDHDPPQSNLPTTAAEISQPVVVNDDDSNISGSSSESDNSPKDEEPTKTDIVKNTEKDD